MENIAAVLRDSRIIQTTNLINKRFDLFGFLVEFTIKQSKVTYIFVDRQDLKPDDIDDLNQAKIDNPQYYSKVEFLKYLDNEKYLKDLYASDRLKASDIVMASNEDTVIVQRLHSSPPDYSAFGTVELYSTRKSNVTVKDNEIQFANNVTPTVKTIPNISAVSLLFYQARLDIINGFFDVEERKEVAYIIANIALMINMINRDIFNSIFKDSGIEITNYIAAQNSEWSLDIVPEKTTVSAYRLFYRGLASFYHDTYLNQLAILRSTNSEKLYWLVSILSQAALVVLPLKTKIDLLLFLAKNKLKESYENEKDELLVIRILLSFNENNINEIDGLLDALILNKLDVNNSETLYESLYKRMSTSTNFTEGLFSLYSWVFKTKFKPNQTKGQYVQAVYALWQYSKYNPYNENGDIKSKTLGFRVLDPAFASFSVGNSNDNKDMLFYYSHVVGYERTNFQPPAEYTGPELFLYKEKISEAAPIVMPYESSKFIGIFFDNFNFTFSGQNLLAYQELPTGYTYNQHNFISDYSNPIPQISDVLYGKYHILQPVSVLNTNRETKAPFITTDGNEVNIDGSNINSFIPVFVLEYIANAADRSNVETIIGYIVDGALTLTGIGNLAKLRYLRWAAAGAEEVGLWSMEGLRIVVGGVDFTTGVLSYLLNFANCDDNNKFCKVLKGFLDALMIASLSINSIDSLATLTARRKARQLLEIASDSTDEETILSDLENSLGGGEAAGEVASKILKFADLSSRFDEFFNHAKKIGERVRNKVAESERLIKLQNFNKFFYSTEDIQEVVEHLSRKVNYAGQLLDKTCADFVFIASKIDKRILKEELIKQMDFFYDEILKRRFPSGFSGLNQYRTFCNKVRTFFTTRIIFWEESILDEIDWSRLGIDEGYVYDNWSNFNFNDRVELIVQGSANRKYFTGDPLINVSADTLPSGIPGDFEFGLRMSETDFKIFMELAIATVRDQARDSHRFLSALEDCKRKGFLDKKTLLTIDLDILDDLRNTVKNDTRFPKRGGEDISFAIVRANGPYDLEPNLNFEY